MIRWDLWSWPGKVLLMLAITSRRRTASWRRRSSSLAIVAALRWLEGIFGILILCYKHCEKLTQHRVEILWDRQTWQDQQRTMTVIFKCYTWGILHRIYWSYTGMLQWLLREYLMWIEVSRMSVMLNCCMTVSTVSIRIMFMRSDLFIHCVKFV